MATEHIGRDPYMAIPIIDGPMKGQTYAWPHSSFQVDSSPGTLGSLPTLTTYHLRIDNELGWVWSVQGADI
jgi:hypothetical protein